MDRRETLKSLLIGGMAGATLGTAGCKTTTDDIPKSSPLNYGRTPPEKVHDEKVMSEVFFTDHELATIATLCDIILPATATAVSAVEAGVPEFVEFIVKDMPDHQIPLRGGLMWLDGESNRRFNLKFINCDEVQQIKIVDDIAYPDPNGEHPELGPGIEFFRRMRNLTLTGYYTTKMGIDDLGYAGNRPNVWDGVPQEVLDEHGLAYDEEWIPKFVDQSKRDIQAEWDEAGNLLT
jgi:hypothetical protein